MGLSPVPLPGDRIPTHPNSIPGVFLPGTGWTAGRGVAHVRPVKLRWKR